MSTVIVFAKTPRPGMVKTRLQPVWSPEAAAELAHAFLADVVGRLRKCNAELLLAVPDDEDGPGLAATLPGRPPTVNQGPGDLGARLAFVTDRAFSEGRGPVAVVGSDHPDLPVSWVERALAAAAEGRVGYVPSDDGGYALLALPHAAAGMFAGVPWSTDGVDTATRNNAAALELILEEIGTWYDVDRPEDVARLRRRPDLAQECPASAAALSRWPEGADHDV